MQRQLRNDDRPLRFHEVHGDNVKLLKVRYKARRYNGFSKGLVFSDRPVKILEPVYIKFVEMATNWSGVLRIGFTTNDPASMKCRVPTYACPDLTHVSGNWVKAIAERMPVKDSVLYFYVDPNGNVQYGVNSVHYGIFFGGVNTSGKLWAVIDIYGNTVAIEILNPHIWNYNNDSLPVNDLTAITRNEFQNSAHSPMREENIKKFHLLHGRNVDLSCRRTVASRIANLGNNAYVFTERSFMMGENVGLHILQIKQVSNGNFVYGITSCDPSTLSPEDLPENPEELMDRSEYWIVKYDVNLYDKDDVIIYCTNTEGEVSVMKNWDEKLGTFYVDPTQPLWMFFNISARISVVRLIESFMSVETSNATRQLENVKVSVPAASAHQNVNPGPSSQQTPTECVICYEKPVDCVLYRCGHMCICYRCALRLRKPNTQVICPICREKVWDVIKIYR